MRCGSRPSRTHTAQLVGIDRIERATCMHVCRSLCVYATYCACDACIACRIMASAKQQSAESAESYYSAVGIDRTGHACACRCACCISCVACHGYVVVRCSSRPSRTHRIARMHAVASASIERAMCRHVITCAALYVHVPVHVACHG